MAVERPGIGVQRGGGEGGTGDAEGRPGKLWAGFPRARLPDLGQGRVVVVKKLETGPAMRNKRNQDSNCWLHIVIIITASTYGVRI